MHCPFLRLWWVRKGFAWARGYQEVAFESHDKLNPIGSDRLELMSMSSNFGGSSLELKGFEVGGVILLGAPGKVWLPLKFVCGVLNIS